MLLFQCGMTYSQAVDVKENVFSLGDSLVNVTNIPYKNLISC